MLNICRYYAKNEDTYLDFWWVVLVYSWAILLSPGIRFMGENDNVENLITKKADAPLYSQIYSAITALNAALCNAAHSLPSAT